MSTSLETINNSLFQPLCADEAAMVLGGAATVHTFVDNGNGTVTYVGEDMIIKAPATSAPSEA